MYKSHIDAAVEYASKGLAVLPLKPKDKRPLSQHGVKDATTDRKKLLEWWGKQPQANIGVACGAVSGGLLVIDFDDPEMYGLWFQKLSPALRRLLTIQRTGRGYQSLIRCEDPGNNIKLAMTADGKTGIETRANGGYVVVAPSIHPNGKTYEIIQGALTSLHNAKPAEVSELLERARELGRPDAPEEPPAETWQILTMADAMRPREPLIYRVDGLIAQSWLGMVYGDSGSGKSMLLADMMVCVASGQPWLVGKERSQVTPIKVMQCACLWVDFDNGERRTANRLAAMAKARRIGPDIPLYYVSMPSPWLDASDPAQVNQLIELVRAAGIGMVVIDNLGLVSGRAEENSADMAKVMAGFRRLAEMTAASVWIIHHQNKPNGVTRRAGDTVRGHTSIKASLDIALLVEREEDSSVVQVKATKCRDADVSPFAADFAYEHIDGRGRELLWARYFGTTYESRESRDIEELKLQIINALQDGPLNTRGVLSAVKGQTAKVSALLAEMVEAGTLAVTTGSHGSRLYSLA